MAVHDYRWRVPEGYKSITYLETLVLHLILRAAASLRTGPVQASSTAGGDDLMLPASGSEGAE